MDISRYETSDTFIIADPMRTYTEEIEASFENIYYKHLEVSRKDFPAFKAFKSEVRLHLSRWA
jgi:hypothetical protein